MNRFVKRDGCRVAFEECGSGPGVLFIQGVGVQGRAWRPQTEVLSQHFHCVTIDNRGIGRSEATEGEYSVDALADDALAVLDELEWETANIVGHSLGGLIALVMALRSPKRVRSLSLLCTFANGRAVAPLSWRMIWLGLRSQIGTKRMRRNGFLRLVMPPGRPIPAHQAEYIADLFGHDLANQPSIVAHQLRAMRAKNCMSRLQELQGIATLVVSARFDPIAPPQLGRALADGIPGADYVEVPDASHGLPITHASLVNELLLSRWSR